MLGQVVEKSRDMWGFLKLPASNRVPIIMRILMLGCIRGDLIFRDSHGFDFT